MARDRTALCQCRRRPPPDLGLPRSVPFGDDDTTLRRKLERQADWLATTPIPKLHIAGLPGAIAVIGGRRRAARGGTATVSEVTADLLASYPDISETSIRTNLSTLEFITKGGVVWRRTKADGWPPVPPLRAVRGAFHNGMNVIRVAIPVTSELLRGSGQALHPAVAAAAGVTPGQQRAFTSPHGAITLSWKLSSTRGTNIGPLRALAAAVQTTNGDTLVLALGAQDASLDVTRLRSHDVAISRLQKLLGRRVRSPAAALATALHCRRDDVGAVLRARGDRPGGTRTAWTSRVQRGFPLRFAKSFPPRCRKPNSTRCSRPTA